MSCSGSKISVKKKMSILFSNKKDQLCVNLSHDIKVYFSMNDSILIKNYRDGNCIAVAGGVGVNATRLFSLEREGIKVHHNGSDCMGVEIFPISVSRNVTGTIATISKNHDRMLHHQVLSCEEVYQQEQLPMTKDVEDKALMLMNTCLFKKKDRGVVEYHFQNGLEVIQFSSGHTRYVNIPES